MRLRYILAVGMPLLLTTIAIPAGPARADGVRNDQWYLKNLRISEAHAITKGSGVTVGVVDTGSYPHPDLRSNLLAGKDLVAGQDGDGHSDQNGHGTNMAAVIAAHGRGNSGILGIAPDAKILPVKTANSEKDASGDDLGKGIDWAAKNGAKVINVSGGSGPTFEIEDAVANALDSDVVVVAAVGNAPESVVIDYPAAIDGVLVVGAVGRNGRHAAFSLDDPRVQICAPGEDITTAEPKSKYVDSNGTSPATAIVSGAAALVRAKFPQLSGPEVINRLTSTADDIGTPGRDKECGFGVLNIVKALTAEVPPVEGATASARPSTTVPSASSTAVPRSSGSTAAPESSSSSVPLVLGVLVGLMVAAGLVLGLAVRRRRG